VVVRILKHCVLSHSNLVSELRGFGVAREVRSEVRSDDEGIIKSWEITYASNPHSKHPT